MNPQLKAKWVEALRSGKYEQGQNQLYADGKFCCLGVLCDIDPDVTIDKEREVAIFDDIDQQIDQQVAVAVAVLPLTYLNRNDIRGDQDLIRMNDDQNKSFNEIADYIEVHL